MRILFSALLLLLTYCVSAQGTDDELLDGYLEKHVAENPVFAEGVTGFYLHDIATDRPLYGYNAERYFVPASNVKLLTFYLAQHLLGDRTPAVFYRRYPDRIELWGAGYPLLLHPRFREYDALGPWLSEQTLPVVVHLSELDAPPRYGAGWSWDDYNYGYVYERSALPVYGNRLYLELGPPVRSGIPQLYGSPPEVASALVQDERQERGITRAERANVFTLGRNFDNPANFPLERALIVSPAATGRQLREAFGSDRIRLGSAARPPRSELESLDVVLPDTLFRRLLQQSDNYLAEQLILQCAVARYGVFTEQALFDYATDILFPRMGMGKLSYADGSGLSRYNLVKPRQFGQLVATLYREVGRERLLDLLPAGGGNGTLAGRFDDRAQTYVWAKTGSLSGVICISGLLRSRSGRWLAFSFLHNNVLDSSAAYYREMERVLGKIYDTL